MMRLLPLTAAVTIWLPASAAAQEDPYVQQMTQMWANVVEAMGESDMVQGHDPVVGSIGSGKTERLSIEIQDGIAYTIVAVCDQDCTDLDLRVYGPRGTKIGEDVETDATPVVEFTASGSGTYQLEGVMVSCSVEPCSWIGGVFVEAGAAASARSGSGDAAGESHTGSLAKGDNRLESGEYFDVFSVNAEPGSRIVADLTSRAFDPYLMVRSPSGESSENDDYDGSAERSRLEVDVTEGGEWQVVVTSYAKDMTGAYTVAIDVQGGTTRAAGAGGVRHESGSLDKADETLRSGEYADVFTFKAQKGEEIVVDLRSSAFDPYLIVQHPDDEQTENDDYEGSASRSLVSLTATASGEYRVLVTSYKEGETGSYDLTIQQGADVAQTAASAGPRVERGALESGDQTLKTDEYADVFTFQGRPGESVTVDVASSEFDTYLMLLGPNDFRAENDDAAAGHSTIETQLTEVGEYRVVVTSYKPEETGSYELTIASEASLPGNSAQRDVQTLALGQSVEGVLEDGDGTLDSGEFRDLWVFDADAGESVVIELTSPDFDTYVGLTGPDGQVIDENDDADGRADLSRIDATLRESGRYRVVATSYAAGQSGSYRVSLNTAQATGRVAQGGASAPTPGSGEGTVYGIFAGVSDYGGRANNLAYTADDASRFAEAMMAGADLPQENAVVLLDDQATVANIRSAFARLGERMGPDDQFVFFYSGHGSRRPRPDGYERADPDGLDETIELYDAGITDNEFNDLLGTIHPGISVIVLDACFSGGFSKDVISEPGRIGFFSSEEDVTSQVAAKFRAGGYLAAFVADAVEGRYADADRDGSINAIELSQYLHERYRADVKAAGAGDYVRTGGPQSGFQHLVVDRGSIGPYDIVFR